MLHLLILTIFFIIVVVIVFIAMGRIASRQPPPLFDFNNINLENLIDATDIPRCIDGGKFISTLEMIVDTEPVVATLACLDAPTEDIFATCESIVVPQANDVLANPVAYERTDDGIVLLYAQRLATGCM